MVRNLLLKIMHMLSLAINPLTDFIIGYMNFGRFKYADASGYSLDNQGLVFKVKLPKGANPLV